MAHPYLPTTDTTAPANTHSEKRLGQSYDSDVTSTNTGDKIVAQSTSTSPASEPSIVATESITKSPLERLPGELRNRIYRAYFDLSTKERKEKPDLRATAPSFLPLLHTSHRIRSEAGSIFNKERLCNVRLVTNSKTEHISQSYEEFWLRVKCVCALVAIRDIHSRISVTCTMRAPADIKFNTRLLIWSLNLGQFISQQKDLKMVRSPLSTEPVWGHPFFSEEGYFPMEVRIGDDYLIQAKTNRLDGSAIEQTFQISGPLAELNCPEGDWSELNTYWPRAAAVWARPTD